jgi:ferredoxin
MKHKFITHQELASLVAELIGTKTRVIAPARAADDPQQVDYRLIDSFEEAAFGVAIPRRSLKEFFLPATEVLLHYKQTHAGVEITEVPTEAPPQVIFGALPCDVAGLKTVDKVMSWDYRDELWFGRREASTIVTLLCPVMDHTCFCTAVGLGPEDTAGADAMLAPADGGYVAYLVTERGEKLFANCGAEVAADMLATAEAAKIAARAKVEPNLAAIPAEFAGWLKQNFDHPVWKTIALRCHGCGACAALCPTCHCFDIVDEHISAEEGVRRRNWDSCQTALFTVHASGHNPRASQSERFRQRIQHKFSIYPSRFGEMLCTGCGRCSRVCPGGMDLPSIVSELMTLAKAKPEVSGQ